MSSLDCPVSIYLKPQLVQYMMQQCHYHACGPGTALARAMAGSSSAVWGPLVFGTLVSLLAEMKWDCVC